MKNLQDAKTRVTVSYSWKITMQKHVDCNGYQKHDIIIHSMMWTDTVAIPGLNEKIFRMTRALKKCFQVTQEGEFLK